MSDTSAACETPLIELARSVPKDLRGEWEIQWAEDGTPTGHAMAPVGRYLHDLADEVDRLRVEIERARIGYGRQFNAISKALACLDDVKTAALSELAGESSHEES